MSLSRLYFHHGDVGTKSKGGSKGKHKGKTSRRPASRATNRDINQQAKGNESPIMKIKSRRIEKNPIFILKNLQLIKIIYVRYCNLMYFMYAVSNITKESFL